jgi:hypothetical protein
MDFNSSAIRGDALDEEDDEDEDEDEGWCRRGSGVSLNETAGRPFETAAAVAVASFMASFIASSSSSSSTSVSAARRSRTTDTVGSDTNAAGTRGDGTTTAATELCAAVP